MSECTDRKLGKLLYDYGLGTLTEDEQVALEIHIMECNHCYRLACGLDQVSQLLRHDPEIRRFAEELDRDATRAARPRSSKAEPASLGRRRLKILRALAIAAAVLAIMILKPWKLQFQTTDEVVASENRLAVVPFDNLADESDSAMYGAVISNLLVVDLSASRQIQLVSDQYLRDIRAKLAYDLGDTGIAIPPITFAKRAGARWLLTGTIVQVAPRPVLTASLTEVASGAVLAEHRISLSPNEDAFVLIDSLAARIRYDLLGPPADGGEPDPAIADVTTHSLRAYRWYVEGLAHLSMYRTQDARYCFKSAIEHDSAFAMAYYWLGYLGVPDMLDMAVEFSHKTDLVGQLRIKSLKAGTLGELDEATRLLREIVEIYPHEKRAWVDLADFAGLQLRYEDAESYLTKALEIDPLYKEAWNSLAYVRNLRGEVDQALAALDRYAEIAPDEPNPFDSRGEILAKNGRLDEAIDAYEKACAIRPDFADFHSMLTLGQLYIFRGDYAKAAECFQRIMSDGDKVARSVARTHLALVPLYQGKLEETLRVLEDGIRADEGELATAGRDGNRDSKHLATALIHLEMNRYDLAVSEIEKAIEIAVSVDPRARYGYGPAYALVLVQSGDKSRAEKIADELEKASEDVSVSSPVAHLFARAAVEYARGNHHQVITYMENCAESVRFSFDDNYVLGRARLATGDYSGARDILQATLADFSDAERLLAGIWAVEAYYYLGLACENSGLTDLAAGEYKKFLGIWADADPALEPLLSDARTRLARLEHTP